jgi:hypothetical protein
MLLVGDEARSILEIARIAFDNPTRVENETARGSSE